MPTTARSASIVSSRMRNLTNMTKPLFEISFGDEPRGQPASWITSLSTLDSISGRVYITSPRDLKFDTIEVAFKGMANVLIHQVATVAAASQRQFQNQGIFILRQPDVEEHVPSDGILKSGITYKIPFTFVVPAAAPLSTCRHKVNNPKIRDMHLLLPPSLGDPELAGTGKTLLTDMTQEMAKISYSVVATILQDKSPTRVAEGYRKVRVIPATEELPPVDVDGQDNEYCLRKEKNVRKHGLMGGKLARVVAQANQPPPFHLPAPNTDQERPITTMATVMLRWDPKNAAEMPPRIGCLTSKLEVLTYSSVEPLRDFPTRRNLLYDARQYVAVDTVFLASRNMGGVEWERHDGSTSPENVSFRRSSTLSIGRGGTCPQPSRDYVTGSPFYTAQIFVPVSLPKDKGFVPTFYNCLISRVYCLHLSVNLAFGVSVDLKVPVQVTSAASAESLSRQASLTQEAEASVDEFFGPRRTTSNPQEMGPTGQQSDAARDLPPEYCLHAPTRSSGVVPVCG